MTKFNLTVSVSIYPESSYSSGSPLYYETITAASIPAKIVFALLAYVFKLTEGYIREAA